MGEAANGEDALELVEKLEPDLLLTDVKMPFISGIELARQVRRNQTDHSRVCIFERI